MPVSCPLGRHFNSLSCCRHTIRRSGSHVHTLVSASPAWGQGSEPSAALPWGLGQMPNSGPPAGQLGTRRGSGLCTPRGGAAGQTATTPTGRKLPLTVQMGTRKLSTLRR